MPVLQVDLNVPLYYEVHGRGPALILLNGLSQSTTNWLTQSRRLAKHFTVVVFDARGQGKTPVGRTSPTPEVLVNDLERLMDVLGLPRAHICGFSFGARVALAFAATCPKRVDKLVLTSLGVGEDPQRRLIVRSWIEVLERGGLEAMTWCALPHIFGRGFIERYERQMNSFVRATMQRNNPEGIQATLDMLSMFGDPFIEAERVHVPTLMIAADADPLVDLDLSRRLTASFHDGTFELFESCGHTIPIEYPTPWRERVMGFLR